MQCRWIGCKMDGWAADSCSHAPRGGRTLQPDAVQWIGLKMRKRGTPPANSLAGGECAMTAWFGIVKMNMGRETSCGWGPTELN